MLLLTRDNGENAVGDLFLKKKKPDIGMKYPNHLASHGAMCKCAVLLAGNSSSLVPPRGIHRQVR